jgi:hypothetical protein
MDRQHAYVQLCGGDVQLAAAVRAAETTQAERLLPEVSVMACARWRGHIGVGMERSVWV